MFLTNENVSIHDHDFEFYLKGKPTGEYARGRVIKRDGNEYTIRLFCNGEIYLVREKFLYREWQ